MGKSRICFRADGNEQIGLGHVSRCCALAQMLNEKFECIFIIREPLPETKEEILKSCSAVIELTRFENNSIEAREVSTLIGQQDIVVLDGYSFTTEYQAIVKETGCLLVCIDDIYACHFVSDVIINHAGGIRPDRYSKEFYTQLYLGPEYAMLRLPFRPGITTVTREQGNKNVLVLLGGADPANETRKIVERCCKARPENTYHIVVGAAYAYFDDLRIFLKGTVNFDAALYRNISADELVTLMKKCGTAITAPSTVAFEYLFIGGCLYLQAIADNQKDVYKYFVDNKLAKSFTDFLTGIEGPGLQKKIKLEYDFVDNLRKIFSLLSLEAQVTIRRASAEDAELIFNWINDPAVRSQSYSSADISWETHSAWFKKKLDEANCRIYLVFLKEHPAGQIRFDMKNETATLSYLIDKEHRGKGLGSIILKKGIQAVLTENNTIKTVTGFVKKNNIPSCRSFRKMGFAEEEAQQYQDSFRYTLSL